jgi:hypothetical protein
MLINKKIINFKNINNKYNINYQVAERNTLY